MNTKKKILSDSVWSISGLVLMNVILQFAVYPQWERRAGEAALGNILYLISLMNIFAVSAGVSVSYARLKRSAEKGTGNSPYLIILAAASVIAAAFGAVISVFGGVSMSMLERVMFCAVSVLTMWRYYADVEYKLSLCYKRYFLYYLCISVGYAIGIALFYITGVWCITLLVGEGLGLTFVLIFGKVFRRDENLDREELSGAFRLVLVLLGSEMLSTLIFNADRILLKIVVNEIAVTEYYLASLLGKTVALLTTPLTGVIVGYLSKYKGKLTAKAMSVTAVLAVALTALGTLACTVGSYILIPILYPEQYAEVKQYFLLANMAQVIFFVGSVITVVLLRFAKSRYQIYITAVYAIAFLCICIPSALKYGLEGFCRGLAAVTAARLLFTVLLGYFSIINNKKQEKKEKNNDA